MALTVRLKMTDHAEAADIVTWLKRQGIGANVDFAEGKLGSAEFVTCVVSGASVARAFAPAVKEWIRARRTTITLEIEGRGELKVQGDTDVEMLVAALTAAEGIEDDDD